MITILKKYPIYVLFFAMLTSCANSIIEDAPWNNTPVPVVFSILSPNEAVQVYLYRTYNKDIPAVKNPYPEAKVYVCGSDSVWIELTRLSSDTTIFEDSKKMLIIKMGKTYSLKVELNDRTLHAQTTIISEPALIANANCVFSGYTYNSYIRDSFPKHVLDTININDLTVKFSLPGNVDCEYWFSAFSEQIYGNRFPNQGSFQANDFGAPKDSTTFTLKLITVDPNLNRYLSSQSISTTSESYSYNSPVLALIQSFGGVLPQFSNIVNGVGLFGNTVSDSKRVTIKPLAN